jgi:uncharacterized protein
MEHENGSGPEKSVAQMQATERPEDVFADELCKQCGRCCCRKFVLQDQVYYTPFFCDHLNQDTGLCKVYERRSEVNPECMAVSKGLERSVFPADCPYVSWRDDYSPPVEDFDLFGLGPLAREIATELGVNTQEFDRVFELHQQSRKRQQNDD